MTFTAYADEAALGNWLGAAAPSNAVALLRSASFVVAKACNRDPYSDTPSTADAQVLADATCAQVATWLAVGVNPAAAGTDVRVKVEAKLGSGDVKWDALSAQTIADAATALSPEAESILQTAGLLWLPVPLGASPCDELPHYGIDDRPLYPAIYTL